MPVRIGQPAAEGKQLLRTLGDLLVRVARKSGALIENEYVEAERALLDGIEEGFCRIGLGKDDAERCGSRCRGKILQFADDRGTNPFSFRCTECLEDSGGECGRALLIDSIDERLGSLLAIGAELDDLLRRGNAVRIFRVHIRNRGERRFGDLCELCIEPLHTPRRREFDELGPGSRW